MTVDFACDSFTKNQTATPPDRTNVISGLGFEPKLVVLWCSQATAEDTIQDGAAFSYGCSDGTDERSMWVGSADNVGTTDTNRFANSTKAICLRNISGGALLAEADVTMQSDGFTVTWTENDTSAFIVKWWAIGGDEITVDVFEFAQPNQTGTNISQSVTTSLADADFVTLFGIGSSIKDSLTGNLLSCIGMASGPSNEGLSSAFSADAQTIVSNTTRYQRTNRIYAVATDSVLAECEFTNFTGTGFDLNWTDISSASARAIFGFTIKGGGWEVGNGLMKNTPDGTRAYTTTFEPQGLITLSTGQTDQTTIQDQNRLLCGASHGLNGDVSCVETDTDNVGTTNSQRESSATYCLDPIGFANTLDSRGKGRLVQCIGFYLGL